MISQISDDCVMSLALAVHGLIDKLPLLKEQERHYQPIKNNHTKSNPFY